MKTHTPGTTIRNKHTNQTACVLTILKVGVLVAELSDGKGLLIPKVLLPRDFSDWVDDLDIEVKKKPGVYGEEIGWVYKPIAI